MCLVFTPRQKLSKCGTKTNSLKLITSLRGRHDIFPHFGDEETEEERSVHPKVIVQVRGEARIWILSCPPSRLWLWVQGIRARSPHCAWERGTVNANRKNERWGWMSELWEWERSPRKWRIYFWALGYYWWEVINLGGKPWIGRSSAARAQTILFLAAAELNLTSNSAGVIMNPQQRARKTNGEAWI